MTATVAGGLPALHPGLDPDGRRVSGGADRLVPRRGRAPDLAPPPRKPRRRAAEEFLVRTGSADHRQGDFRLDYDDLPRTRRWAEEE